MTQAGERAVTSAGKVTKATDEEKQSLSELLDPVQLRDCQPAFLPRSYQSQWPGGRFVLSFSYLRAMYYQ
jgi:hypothetical protein